MSGWRRLVAGRKGTDRVGGSRVLDRFRNQLRIPRGVPTWAYVAGVGVSSAAVVCALVAGGSWLPLFVQIPLGLCMLVPSLPGPRSRYQSFLVVVCSVGPAIALTWTGGSPMWFTLIAISVMRVSVVQTFGRSIAYGALCAAVIAGRQFIAGYDFQWLVWESYVQVGLALGWTLRSQAKLVRQIRAARDEHAQLAALEERRRIARDVHDVLAHTLTILMVHLNSARLSVVEDPEGTAELLDEVAAYGRNALVEIRRTVGLLGDKAGVGASARGPIEAAHALEELVESYRKAGADIDLRLDVEMEHMRLLAAAPPAIWHAGYRIVQEALANTTKHAPGAHVVVTVYVDDAGLHMNCANALSCAVLELPSGGNGLNGMRERVVALGGTFSAGVQGSSWVVHAELPLSGRATPERRAPQKLGRAS